VLQFSCIADSVAANAGPPLDVLFWCMGSWGSAYPLTRHKGNDSIVEDNAALASRIVYKPVREYTLFDTATNVCRPTNWPIWTKSHYRFQVMRPVRGYTCQPIGRSGLIWGKNPRYSAGGNAADNFDWVLVRNHLCCIGYSLY
jgi:conjugal transfer pilus assembly protein TraU